MPYAVAAVLVEVWGRRPTLAAFLAGSAVSAGLFAVAVFVVAAAGALVLPERAGRTLEA